MPTLSVIVPVYKVESCFHRCVDSILAQTFYDFELILVDDGSPDNCPAICDAYATMDSRVSVIHQKNGGLSAARNAGIDWVFNNSNSQWLTFVDSDDWIHPQMLEHLLLAVQKHSTKISVCSYNESDGSNFDFSNREFNSELWSAEEFYFNHSVNATVAWGKLYHKTCFTTMRYPVGKVHEDEYVTYRLLFENFNLSFLPLPYYGYYNNPNSITKGQWSPRRMDAFTAYDEQIRFFSKAGCTALRCFRIQNYIYTIIDQLSQIKKTTQPRQFIKYEKKLLAKGRYILLKYLKDRIFTVRKDAWIFELFFPSAMRFYWISLATRNKLIRRNK